MGIFKSIGGVSGKNIMSLDFYTRMRMTQLKYKTL